MSRAAERIAGTLRPQLRARPETREPLTLSSKSAHVEALRVAAKFGRTAGGSFLVRHVRRVLYRLLAPLIDDQERFAISTARLVAQLDARMAMIERQSWRVMPAGAWRRPRVDIDLKELEDELRGTEQSIRDHQARYLHHFGVESPVLDVGCGRGEFMELLRDSGIEARGVDSDSSMVRHCRGKGFDVEESHALDYLGQLPSQSLGGIFCAQVVEHLEPPELVELVEECARVVRPGGVVVLETVNTESLINFAAFYMDITHVRPYHSNGLAALLRSRGFDSVEIEYSIWPDDALQIPPLPSSLAEANPELDTALQRLSHLVYGPLAYAAVARSSKTGASR